MHSLHCFDLRSSSTVIHLLYHKKLISHNYIFFTALIYKRKFHFYSFFFLTLQSSFPSQLSKSWGHYTFRGFNVAYKVLMNSESSLTREQKLSGGWLSSYLILSSIWIGNPIEINLIALKLKLYIYKYTGIHKILYFFWVSLSFFGTNYRRVVAVINKEILLLSQLFTDAMKNFILLSAHRLLFFASSVISV